MKTQRLGRTELQVSVMGLGGGGHSKLGFSTGGSHENAVKVVQRALDLGITLLDGYRGVLSHGSGHG